jgi:hypothetical protein
MSGAAAELLGRAKIIQLATNGLGWRSYLRVHPAAELFPRKGAEDGYDEQRMFEESIKKDGLKVPILIWHNWENRSYITYVVDGVRRLDAMETQGLPIVENGKLVFDREVLDAEADPHQECFIRNFHRRNLSQAQKRQLIFDFVKRHYLAAQDRGVRPWSDRRLAEQFRCDHHLIAKVREELISTGEISPVEKTEGKDCKARKADRPTRWGPPAKCSFCHQHYTTLGRSADGRLRICSNCAYQQLRSMKTAVLASDTAELLPLLTQMGLVIDKARADADPPMRERLREIARYHAGFYAALGIAPPTFEVADAA